MSCAHCEELAEQVAYLKSELGIVRSLDERAKLRSTFDLTGAEAALVSELFAARGRLVRHYQLLEALPTENDDRNRRILNTYICRIRARIGIDTISTIWGEGYRLTATGLSKIAEVI